MTLVRRSAGFGGVALSVVGLLLCVAVAAGAWAGKRKLDAVNVALVETADDAFAFMEARLDRAGQTLDAGRPRVNRLAALAERLQAKSAATGDGDVRTQLVEPLSAALDETFGRLRSAEDALESIRATAQGVNRVSQAIASARAGDESVGGGTAAREIAELSAAVADAAARAQAMRQELVEFRDSGQLAREVVARMVTRAAALDERLASASARISAYKAKVSTARQASADLGRRVRRWTALAAAVVVLGSLWFAASQVLTMKLAWRLARPAPRPSGAPA